MECVLIKFDEAIKPDSLCVARACICYTRPHVVFTRRLQVTLLVGKAIRYVTGYREGNLTEFVRDQVLVSYGLEWSHFEPLNHHDVTYVIIGIHVATWQGYSWELNARQGSPDITRPFELRPSKGTPHLPMNFEASHRSLVDGAGRHSAFHHISLGSPTARCATSPSWVFLELCAYTA